MKLYPKKLSGIEALRREKKVLEYARTQIDIEGAIPFSSVLTGKESNSSEEKQASFIDNIAASKSIPGFMLKTVVPILLKKFRDTQATAIKDKGRKLAFKAIGEFAGGYLKWKLIELSFKGIKKFIAHRKNRQAAAVK